MSKLKDINKEVINLSADNIIIDELGLTLAEAIRLRLIPIPQDVEDKIKHLDGVMNVVEKVNIDVVEDGGNVSAEGDYSDGTINITLHNIKGADGIDGADGADGKDGIDGVDGVDGKDGADGKDGEKGEKGDRGNDGKDGTAVNISTTLSDSMTSAAAVGLLKKELAKKADAGATPSELPTTASQIKTSRGETVEKELTDLRTQGGGTGILSLFPRTHFLPKMATLKKKVPYNYSPKCEPLSLLWFSDLHGNINNLKRIVEWRNEYKDYIDDVLNCGDTVTSNISSSTGEKVVQDYYENGGDKMLTALGNHDVCAGTSTNGYSGNKDMHTIYNLFTARMSDQLGVIFPDGAATNGYNFFYKDYLDKGEKGVRLIVLDFAINSALVEKLYTGSDIEQKISEAEAYEDAQFSWFKTIVEQAKNNGYMVIAASHYGRQSEQFDTNSGFCSPAEFYMPTADDYLIPERYLEFMDTKIGEGLDFACWLGGHVHQDYCGAIKGHTKQLCINITTASTRLDTAQSGEPARLDGTITQDAFNVISFINYGKSIHTIRIVRIGYNFDNYMRPIDMIAIDYKNVKLLDKSLKL